MYALAGGLFPAVLWLWFWLREDRVNPEPRKLIFFTFLMGMLAVPAVLPVQKFASNFGIPGALGVLVLFGIWALAEELFKFIAAYAGGLRHAADDEPIDMVIYMITAALGFAALENTLFLIDPIVAGNFADSIITGNMRFIGASLLHVLCSGLVGVFMALAFYRGRGSRILHMVGGIILATALHSLFNLSIINSNDNYAAITFSVVWILVLGLLFFLERVKKIRAFQ